jgi:hypothetical protein
MAPLEAGLWPVRVGVSQLGVDVIPALIIVEVCILRMVNQQLMVM